MAGRWEVFCGGAAHTEMAKCASSAEALPNASGKVLSEAHTAHTCHAAAGTAAAAPRNARVRGAKWVRT